MDVTSLRKVFMLQGGIIGILGALIGGILGVFLALGRRFLVKDQR